MASMVASYPPPGSVSGNTVVLGEPQRFDEQNPKWKTCDFCHLRSSMQVIAILDIVFEVIHVVLLVCGTFGLWWKSVDLMILAFCGIAGKLLIILVSVLTFWGIRRIRPGLMIPSIVLRGFTIIYSAVFGIMLVGLGFDSEYNYIKLSQLFAAAYAYCIMIIAFEVWFFIVFVRGYYYLKEKQHWQMTVRYPVPIISIPNPGYQTPWRPASLAGLAGNGISVVNPGAHLNQYLPANQSPSHNECTTHEATPTPSVHNVQT